MEPRSSTGRRSLFGDFLGLALITGCVETHVTPTLEDQRAVIEATVDHVVLPGERPRFESRVDALALLDTPDGRYWQTDPLLKPGVTSSFLDANEEGVTHDASWFVGRGVGMVGPEELEAFHVSDFGRVDLDGFWERLRRGPPECTDLVSVSAPGFSSDGSQALVLAKSASGSHEAYCALYLLERRGARWGVVSEWLLWLA